MFAPCCLAGAGPTRPAGGRVQPSPLPQPCRAIPRRPVASIPNSHQPAPSASARPPSATMSATPTRFATGKHGHRSRLQAPAGGHMGDDRFDDVVDAADLLALWEYMTAARYGGAA